MIFELIGDIISILADGYAESRRRNQEKLNKMCDEAYYMAQHRLRDLGSYDPRSDGKFISVIRGCE